MKCQLSKQDICRSFSKAAQNYDKAAVLQREVNDRLMQRLQYIPTKPEMILDLGAGTGSLSRLLKPCLPQATVYSVDISLGMLFEARSLASWNQEKDFCCGDAEQLPFADHSFDLVISNLMLHWCSNYKIVLQEVQRVLRPGGVFLFTTLGSETLYELRNAWKQVDNEPHVHDFLDLRSIGDALLANHYVKPVMDMEKITLWYFNVLEIMRDLKTLGAHNLRENRRKTLTGKSRMQTMLVAYEKYRVEEGGRFPATYEVIFGYAIAPQPSALRSIDNRGEVRISVNDLLKQLHHE